MGLMDALSIKRRLLNAVGDLIKGGAGGAPTILPIGTNGQVLTAVGGDVAWGAPVGFANPMAASGDVIYGGAAGVATRLPVGTAGQVLTLAAGVPSWVTPVAPGMTNPMTSIGDIIKGGAAGVAQRLAIGTTGQVLTVVAGASAWAAPTPMTAASDIIVGGAAGVATRLPKGTDGQVLGMSQGTGGIAWLDGLPGYRVRVGDSSQENGGLGIDQGDHYEVDMSLGYNLFNSNPLVGFSGTRAILEDGLYLVTGTLRVIAAVSDTYSVPAQITISIGNGTAAFPGSYPTNSIWSPTPSFNTSTPVDGGCIGTIVISDTLRLNSETTINYTKVLGSDSNPLGLIGALTFYRLGAGF